MPEPDQHQGATQVPGDNTAVLEMLQRYWGFDTLRPLQQEAIDANLSGRDSLLVMPTGGGKSLTYQLPPLVTGSLDIVVSPLIALMKDQVDGLRAAGISATSIDASLSGPERAAIREDLAAGSYRLLFLSPEMLVRSSILSLLRQIGVRAVAIDEAHCISEWGHDFRPEYRMLSQLREYLPGVSVHACTATATPQVREDILTQLQLDDPAVLVGSFDRPNLTYRIRPRVSRGTQILDAVRAHADEAVIVYALSRRETETISEQLVRAGVRAAFYHAGLPKEKRRRVHEAFAREELDVVVATIAFGMGIDRSNVRAVIHASMPRSIENFQQETGRAGRDGEPAECVLFHSWSDVARWRSLAERSFDGAIDNASDPGALRSALKAQLANLDAMNTLATSAQCRHRALVEYFGEPYEQENCGSCDVCLDEIELMDDSTTVARKILSCVARVEERFGVQHVADVLAGAKTDMIRRCGHESLSTYGLLSTLPKAAISNLIHQLIGQGFLERTPGDRPVVQLNAQSRPLLRGEVEVGLLAPNIKSTRRTSRAEATSWEGVDRSLFDALRELRRSIAAEIGKPPYVVFPDSTLRTIALHRPATIDTFSMLKGVGEKKRRTFGPRFLEALDAWDAERGGGRDIGMETA